MKYNEHKDNSYHEVTVTANEFIAILLRHLIPENFKTIREAKGAKDLSDDTMTRLVSTLVNFDLAKVENEINKELDKGILSDKLSSEITKDSKPDNITYKPTTDPSLSQKEIVRTNLLEFVRGVDAYLNRSNLK